VAILLSLHATAAPRVLTVVLANTLYVAGFAVLFVAFRRLVGSRVRGEVLVAVVPVAGVLITLATYTVDSMALRLLIQAGPEMVLFSVAAWDLVRASAPARPTGRYIVGGFVILDVFVCALRTEVILRSGAPASLFAINGVILSTAVRRASGSRRPSRPARTSTLYSGGPTRRCTARSATAVTVSRPSRRLAPTRDDRGPAVRVGSRARRARWIRLVLAIDRPLRQGQIGLGRVSTSRSSGLAYVQPGGLPARGKQ
jgi:hypothetical protein